MQVIYGKTGMISCFASIDLHVNKTMFYSCIANPADRWNGWANPYFDKETMIKVIEGFGQSVIRETEDEIHFDPDDVDNYAYRSEHGWQVSGWCWDIYNEKKQYINRDGSLQDSYHTLYVKRVLDAVQTLEDIGGPNTLKDYVAVLNEVKADIEQRLINANARIEDGET